MYRAFRNAMALQMGVVLACLVGTSVCAPAAQAAWRDSTNQATRKNDALEASFQSGLLYRLTDTATGKVLLSVDPAQLPGQMPLFGRTGIDLDKCKSSQEVAANGVTGSFTSSDGIECTVRWTLEPGKGDLILKVSARAPQPVNEIRYILFGCDIASHSVVWVDGYGAGHVAQAPWNETFLGDPEKDGGSPRFIHPLVALFQGEQTGWIVEGRDPRIGPANVMVRGHGNTATVGLVRRFPIATATPELFEVRIRPYSEHWEDAVDPHVAWMEKEAGFVPLEKRSPAWVKQIKNQGYVRVGNMEGLEQFAKAVDPTKTFLGRMVGWRPTPMDHNYPDYRMAEEAKPWAHRAKELGFHLGVHFNSQRVSKNLPEFYEKFRPGYQVVGKDERSNDIYEGINGDLVSCTSAYKPFRDCLIDQMKDAVDNGVDVVYLDESMGPGGKEVVDGVDGVQGLMLLMKEALERYPGIALETEQFNPMTAKYASFALSQMPLGHPLGGYILHRFIHIVPEGVMGSPTSESLMDAFDCWGYMMPGAGFSMEWDPAQEASWRQIAKAFQDYDLRPDGRLPRKQITRFESHYTHGLVPATIGPVPPEGLKLFGFTGRDGVTAYLEKHPNQRGLMLYQPGKEPQWVGMRRYGISEWPGPGALRDWLLYDGNKVLGLDPKQSYFFEEDPLPADRFHVTAIPKDFALYIDPDVRVNTHDVGPDVSWAKINFSGHGEIAMYVPDDCLVFLDGQEVAVDRATKTARATISAEQTKHSTLLAFRRADNQLIGEFADLPWQVSSKQRPWYVGQHIVLGYPGDTPLRRPHGVNEFFNRAGGFAQIVGKLPKASSIHLRGAFRVRPTTKDVPPYHGGVIRINGKEVVRLPGNGPQFDVYPFNIDLSSWAGQNVFLEFGSDYMRPPDPLWTDWFGPHIAIEEAKP